MLTRTFPPELVGRIVEESGKSGQRNRLLPPRVVVYFVLAMCLFSGQGYEEVARLLTQGLAWARRWSGSWQVTTTAAISRARAKLGPEPLRALFEQTAGPVATESTAESVLARELFEALGPDGLLMADRGFTAPAPTGHPAAGTGTVTGRTNASTVGTLPVARGLQ
ncbi:transposase domain-containing protein [Streptomyces prasinus]|uniref:transposase domain-containing protein n=1 Tax=Streptomyces prasinus TaxID=67345 RepID=UPI0033F506EE